MPSSVAQLTAQARYARRTKAADPDGWASNKRRLQQRVRSLHPEKKSAWNKVYKAVKSGLLIRPDACERCGVQCRPEASHDDYAKPLDIEWLCKSCHMRKDSILRRSKQ